MRHLVCSLVTSGRDVTIATRGFAADDFGNDVERVQVDRRDADAMAATFARSDGFDLIYDLMCYNPLDAKISTTIFIGRVDRYVMASTIEVYRPLVGTTSTPFSETAVDLAGELVNLDFPRHDPVKAEGAYGEGKRQSEAWFTQIGAFSVLSIRIGHVLAGPEDFTGRVADYFGRLRQHQALNYTSILGRSSFTTSTASLTSCSGQAAQQFWGLSMRRALGRFLPAISIWLRRRFWAFPLKPDVIWQPAQGSVPSIIRHRLRYPPNWQSDTVTVFPAVKAGCMAF